MGGLAESYVKLALEVGAYAPGYIDAYYGPKEWVVVHNDSALRRGFPAAELRKRALAILNGLDGAGRGRLSELEELRLDFLRRQTIAVKAEIDILSGRKFTFDQESRLFYDAVAPPRAREEFAKTIAKLETELPGPGSLQKRLADFKKGFVIPADRLPTVFAAALAECRRRTLARIALPKNEDFRAEYVKDKPWGAYNWYKGGAFSLIEVNTDLPMHIDAPLRLSSHEGYPGHHVFNSLLEEKLAGGMGWIEFTIYPLFSPQSLIAEGTANFGIELLFPGDERLEFEKKVLYPLAGLDPAGADKYDRVRKLLFELRYAENEAARAFLDRKMSRDDALRWLERYALEPPERAEKSIAFWKQYRSYVINYNLGEDLVRAYVERTAGKDAPLERKWRVFCELLTTPRTPSGLSELGGR
ncbi:MAG: hypothetical protein JXO51_10375 [Candidatus Aminicenantes bacterium]|nr:hypothetical protein [Candidatus Aminicenantes bacterium]